MNVEITQIIHKVCPWIVECKYFQTMFFRLTARPLSTGTVGWYAVTKSWQGNLVFPSAIFMSRAVTIRFLRSYLNSPNYLVVKESATLVEFGNKSLSIPGPNAHLKKRVFLDLSPAEILDRKSSMPEQSTIAGISTKFQYICKV